MKPTYRQQFDKIVGAYLRNELNPLQSCACFIGNLLNGKDAWSDGRVFMNDYYDPYITRYRKERAISCITEQSDGMYTLQEIIDLEKLFLTSIGKGYDEVMVAMKDEDKLFKAMEVTLEALKKLHESKGEKVENVVFTKRVLV